MVLTPFQNMGQKNPVPAIKLGQDNISCGATRLDAPEARPLTAYQHMPAFDYGEPAPSHILRDPPVSDCPRKSIGLMLFCCPHTTGSSLKEKEISLLTLPQRFASIIAGKVAIVKTVPAKFKAFPAYTS